MKKATLLIIFMAIFALTSFAQIDVTVTGSSEVKFGIAFDTVASGFINTNESKISFDIVKGDSEKGGDADVHGFISITGWGASADSADGYADIAGGDVEAKIMTPSMWVKISGTNSSLNFINPVQDDDGDDDNTDEGISPSVSNSGGIVVGLMAGPAAIEIGVYSELDWVGADAESEWGWSDADGNVETAEVWTETETAAVGVNEDHAYGASLKVSVPVSTLTLDAAIVSTINYGTTVFGAGGKLSGTLSIATIYVGADFSLVDTTSMYEAGLGASLALADGLSLAVDASYSPDMDDTDVKVSLTEDGVGGVVAGIGASVALELFNLTVVAPDEMIWNVNITADYTMDTAKLYTAVGLGSDEVVDVKVGAEAYVIENVTLTLEWATDDINTVNGNLTLAAKIAY